MTRSKPSHPVKACLALGDLGPRAGFLAWGFEAKKGAVAPRHLSTTLRNHAQRGRSSLTFEILGRVRDYLELGFEAKWRRRHGSFRRGEPRFRNRDREDQDMPIRQITPFPQMTLPTAGSYFGRKGVFDTFDLELFCSGFNPIDWSSRSRFRNRGSSPPPAGVLCYFFFTSDSR
jgi:hypothetical protein